MFGGQLLHLCKYIKSLHCINIHPLNVILIYKPSNGDDGASAGIAVCETCGLWMTSVVTAEIAGTEEDVMVTSDLAGTEEDVMVTAELAGTEEDVMVTAELAGTEEDIMVAAEIAGTESPICFLLVDVRDAVTLI